MKILPILILVCVVFLEIQLNLTADFDSHLQCRDYKKKPIKSLNFTKSKEIDKYRHSVFKERKDKIEAHNI